MGGLPRLIHAPTKVQPPAASAGVKTCLPIAGAPRGQGLALTGAKPLPPEVLPLLSAYICDKSAPPVLRSWAFALTFSAVSSLRQANAQHIAC